MKRMQSGMLDRKITIERKAHAVDNKGGLNPDTVPYLVDLPASYNPMQARDVLRGGAVGADFDVVFFVRYRTDIHESDEILYDGRKYDIQSVREAVDYGRRQWLEIRARAK